MVQTSEDPVSLNPVARVAARVSRVSRLEATFFQKVNGLHGVLEIPLVAVMQAGALAAVPVAAAVAWRRRGPGTARRVLVAGVAAWVFAKIVKVFVNRGRPGALLAPVVVRGKTAAGLGFPSGHAAVSAAMATVLHPSLGRGARTVAWATVGIVGVARMYVGAHLPLDVAGGFALGALLGRLVDARVQA